MDEARTKPALVAVNDAAAGLSAKDHFAKAKSLATLAIEELRKQYLLTQEHALVVESLGKIALVPPGIAERAGHVVAAMEAEITNLDRLTGRAP